MVLVVTPPPPAESLDSTLLFRQIKDVNSLKKSIRIFPKKLLPVYLHNIFGTNNYIFPPVGTQSEHVILLENEYHSRLGTIAFFF